MASGEKTRGELRENREMEKMETDQELRKKHGVRGEEKMKNEKKKKRGGDLFAEVAKYGDVGANVDAMSVKPEWFRAEGGTVNGFESWRLARVRFCSLRLKSRLFE